MAWGLPLRTNFSSNFFMQVELNSTSSQTLFMTLLTLSPLRPLASLGKGVGLSPRIHHLSPDSPLGPAGEQAELAR